MVAVAGVLIGGMLRDAGLQRPVIRQGTTGQTVPRPTLLVKSSPESKSRGLFTKICHTIPPNLVVDL